MAVKISSQRGSAGDGGSPEHAVSKSRVRLLVAPKRRHQCRLLLGSETLEYDPARMLVFAVDLPVSGQVTRAGHLAERFGSLRKR